LVNVDESGDIVIYDRTRNLFFHEPVMQVAISFDLSEGRQTFLILKNVTDQTQEARVVLDYDDGRSQYNVNLPPVPAQQVSVIDIKHLRDAHVPDRNGSTLPDNVTFGVQWSSAIPVSSSALTRPSSSDRLRAPVETLFSPARESGGSIMHGHWVLSPGFGLTDGSSPHDYPGSPF
jgi:hypothetical protein